MDYLCDPEQSQLILLILSLLVCKNRVNFYSEGVVMLTLENLYKEGNGNYYYISLFSSNKLFESILGTY